MLFDHATTLSFKLFIPPYSSRWTPLISVHQLARLLKNVAIERLTVQGLWDSPESPTIHSLSAPSLMHLDLRWAEDLSRPLRSLDAPHLRQLAIDAQLWPLLTPASTSTLSSRTLLIADRQDSDQIHPDLGASEGVATFSGSIKFSIEQTYTFRFLGLLANRFIWPGLEGVELELMRDTEADLVSVIASRQAGVLRTTEAQYLGNLHDFRSRMDIALREHDAGKVVREAQRIMEEVNAFQLDAGCRRCAHRCNGRSWFSLVTI